MTDNDNAGMRFMVVRTNVTEVRSMLMFMWLVVGWR
jgi:hypothetical protein